MQILQSNAAQTLTQTLPNQLPQNLIIEGNPSDIDSIQVDVQEFGNVMSLDGTGLDILSRVGKINDVSSELHVLPLAMGQGNYTTTISLTTNAANTVTVYVSSFESAPGKPPIMYNQLTINNNTEQTFTDFFAVGANFGDTDIINLEGRSKNQGQGNLTSRVNPTELEALSQFTSTIASTTGYVIDNTDQSVKQVSIEPKSDRVVYWSKLKA